MGRNTGHGELSVSESGHLSSSLGKLKGDMKGDMGEGDRVVGATATTLDGLLGYSLSSDGNWSRRRMSMKEGLEPLWLRGERRRRRALGVSSSGVGGIFSFPG